MANNNNQIFDAAISGFLAATQANRGIPTPLPAAEIAAAQEFAKEVDAAIPADAGIVTPTTSATLIKVQLLNNLVFGCVVDRATILSAAGSYTALAASIAAAYNQAVALMTLP